jgi:hypothetical protein
MFEFDDDLRAAAVEAFTDSLNEVFGRTCRLYFPATTVGMTPIAGDPEEAPTETYADITMSLGFMVNGKWQPIVSPETMRKSGAVVYTRGFIADYENVARCSHMMVTQEGHPLFSHKFKLEGQPMDTFMGIRGKFFTATWTML